MLFFRPLSEARFPHPDHSIFRGAYSAHGLDLLTPIVTEHVLLQPLSGGRVERSKAA